MKKFSKLLVMLVSLAIMLSGCAQLTTATSKEKTKKVKNTKAEEVEDEDDDQEDTTANSKGKQTEPEETDAPSESAEEDVTGSEENVVIDETSEPEEETTATTEATTTEPKPCKLLLDIDFDDNIVLAKYSINVYLDGEKITMLENGEYMLETVSTMTGEHVIRFEKRGEKDFLNSTNSTLMATAHSYAD